VTEVTSTQRWKVGKIASVTGLTVRTLHHYDQIGLVCPSGRTASGHRLYDESDVQRLYQVLALRQLGLPLDRIGEVLGGSTSLDEVLAAHHRFLADQLVAVRELRAHVGTLASILREGPAASVEDFLELIRRVIVVDETAKQYFDADQLADLAERREHLGEGFFADVQAGWADLLPKVADAVESGMDPACPEAQALAARWMKLLEQFHGGDEGLRQGLYRMQADNAEQIEREHGGPSPAQLDFIKAANATRK
jgi:MerR family transcriptional regulator, thiopeptide resistance regulator